MGFSPLYRSLTPMGRSFGRVSALTYLMRVLFSTDDNAPLTNPYTGEVGSLAVVDTTNKLSVASGELTSTGAAGASDPYLASTDSYARAAGLTGYLKFNRLTATGRNAVGWSASGSSTSTVHYLYLRATIANILVGGISIAETTAIGANTYYKYYFVLRSDGCFYIGLDNRLIWVDNAVTTTPVYLANTYNLAVTATTKFDEMAVYQMGAPWNDDYGIATNRVASASIGETTTSEADAHIEFTWTAVTGQTLDFMVRRTDDDNCWIIRGSQSGSTIKIIEKNGGVETERASASQPFTNGAAYRIYVIQEAATIRNIINNVPKISYTSATFNQTATGVKVDRAGANLTAWPLIISGAALTELNRWNV